MTFRRWPAAVVLFIAAVVLPPTLSARADTPNVVASRYDVSMNLGADGSLDVIERIALRVGDRPITWFERRVPDRFTDGLVNVIALMDGREVQPRKGVGVEVRQRSGLDVRWEFEPTANTTRTFELRYRAEHVLVRDLAGPHLNWTALPDRHAYPIDAARVTLRAPQGTLAVTMSAEGGQIQPATSWADGLVVTGTALGANAHVTLDITFSAATINPAEPRWAAAREQQQKLGPAFIVAGLTLAVIGVGVLLMIRVRAARQIDVSDAANWPAEAGDASPAAAAVLVNRGKMAGWPALQAALFRLVRDGHVIVEKASEKRLLKSPTFAVRVGAPGTFAPHEQWILESIAAASAHADLRRLTNQWRQRQKQFGAALRPEVAQRGWLDADRIATAHALTVTGVVLIVGAAVTAAILGVWFVDSLGPALLAIPAGLALDAFLFVIYAESLSRLSEAGERAAARWHARVTELRQVIRAKGAGSSLHDFELWLPLAIAAGQGGRWLKAFEAQLSAGGADLAWLKHMGSAADVHASLATMVAISGASHSGGAGAGGAGGAGGGSSGAG